jgi:hypothetical protein
MINVLKTPLQQRPVTSARVAESSSTTKFFGGFLFIVYLGRRGSQTCQSLLINVRIKTPKFTAHNFNI